MKVYNIKWEVIAIDNGGEYDGVRRIEAGGFTTKGGELEDIRTQLITALSERFPQHQMRATYDTDRVYNIDITEKV